MASTLRKRVSEQSADDTEFSDSEDASEGIESESDQEESDTEDQIDEEGRDNEDIRWKIWGPNDENFTQLPFTANCGDKPPTKKPVVELDFFQLFFTNALIQEITVESNRYAAEKIKKVTPLQKHSIWWSWVDVTLEEMKAFFGVIMNMALHDKSNIKEYFSDEWIDRQPFFKDVFSRKRFLQIYCAFHLNHDPNVVDRGMKVKNVVDYIVKKCREYYIPSQKIAVDESTVRFKGRIIFKMYNPKKPTKWGLRVYVLADSENGYISVFLPYYGASTTTNLIRPDLPFTSRITLHLCNKLLEKSNDTGFHLYTDRFYTGTDLAKELLNTGIQTTGTIMPNRKGLPEEIRKKKIKLKKNETKTFREENMMVLTWKDKRNVHILSTFHNSDIQPVTRTNRAGVVEEIRKPVAISDYTKNMGAVDRADHYISSYGFTRKSLKWWRKMFFWILEVAIVNSYILYSKEREQNSLRPVMSLRYRKALLQQLVGNVQHLTVKND